MDFSILNESSLHNTLKIFYSIQRKGKTEVKKDGFIFDIIDQDNQIIEIQTQNLSKMQKKIEYAIDKKLKFKLVYPLVISRKIHIENEVTHECSQRKSPVKGSIYDIFKELTKIYPYLLMENFSLDVVFVDIIEQRILGNQAIQSKNKRRRYKKNWNKINKRLDKLLEIKTFKKKEDYLNLLPKDLALEFSSKDLAIALSKNKKITKKIINNSYLLIWVFNKMNIISPVKKEKRSIYYKIKD